MDPVEYDQLLRGLSEALAPIPTGVTPRLTVLPDIACVLFDVYGTLFVSGSGDVGTASGTDRDSAFREALAACDVHVDSSLSATLITDIIKREHATAKQHGVRYPEVDILAIWDAVLSEGGQRHKPRDVLKRLAIEYEARINPVWPMPGLTETLTALNRRNMRMGIVSNAQFFTPLLFPALTGRSHTEWGFTEQLCVWSYRQLEAKPSKDLFRMALSVLDDWGIDPSCVLYVGNDKRNDIWPASELGCRTALFAGDKRSLRLREDDPDTAHIEPDCVLTDLSQILDCL